ncbi:MAG: NAD(P)H-dependent oxidoreductase [Sphingobacteriales bacterium]|nr:NAD(P)H-dependent oxidoreductase [Sphingobacteriales bacterium]
MYTVISGTNRNGSNTEKVARLYVELLAEKGIKANYLSMVGLNVLQRNPDFDAIERDILIPSEKFIFISPEYNGSIPGVLKAMIDISDIRKVWWGKKALLTGVSTGRAGNLRGMEDLTGILNYLKMFVHPNKLPISVVDKLMNIDGVIHDASTLHAVDVQLNEFINF